MDVASECSRDVTSTVLCCAPLDDLCFISCHGFYPSKFICAISHLKDVSTPKQYQDTAVVSLLFFS